MGANLVRVEPQALEADLGGMEAEEGDNVSSGGNFSKRTLGGKAGVDGGIRFGMR